MKRIVVLSDIQAPLEHRNAVAAVTQFVKDWQQGFAIFTVDRGRVFPQLVPIVRGRFVVDGETYKV